MPNLPSGTSRDLFVVAVAACLLLANAISIALVWWDKRQAQRDRRRIRERTLHLWAMLGGFPGGAWAMRRFRHKTARASFIRRYVAASALHLAAWAVFVWLVL